MDAYIDKHINTILLSNEKFAGQDMIAYKNADLFAKTLWDIFEPFNFTIKIIVFLQRQDRFLESLYAQRIKRGASFTFKEFCDQIGSIYDYRWDSLLDIYADTFGKENIIARRYLPDSNNLIQHFGELIGSKSLKNYTEKVVKNRGFSQHTTEFVRHINQHLTEEEKIRIRKILRRIDLSPSEGVFFSLKERKKLLDHLQPSNNKVAKEYFNEPNSPLFSDDLDNEKYKTEYHGLTPQASASIFIKMILSVEQDFLTEMEKTRKKQLGSRLKRKVKKIFGRSF